MSLQVKKIRGFVKDKSLSGDILDIMRHHATEPANINKEYLSDTAGTFLCRACGAALFRSSAQFNAGCGWPSYDEAVENAVVEKTDRDGQRVEVSCANCQAHLGHVFDGEGYTVKNRRFCINKKSLDEVSDEYVLYTEEGIFAGGCFWGVEYLLKKLPGVLKTEVGYTGGERMNPSYYDVCSGRTGHFEAVRVVYDPSRLNYESLLKYFFEIHDPTQIDGQGLDRGLQYQSAVFYYNNQQKEIAQLLMNYLKNKKINLATELLPVSIFWPAENNHQQYYEKNGGLPYCHTYTKRFD